MRARDFCYWMQGFFELRAANMQSEDSITPAQIEVITKHLNMVFKHEIDPSAGSSAHQDELDKIHHGDIQTDGASTMDPPLTPAMLKKFEDMKTELEAKLKEVRPHWARPGSDPMMRC